MRAAAPRTSTIGLAALVAAVALALTAGAAAARPPACGQTVRHDVTLRGDLGPCPGDGLVVGADGITIDLGGHAIISASGAHTGIDTTGHRRITVRHGALRSFGVQIAARRPPTGSPVTADRFVGLRFVNSSFAVVVESDGNLIAGDVSELPAGGGVGGGDYNVDGAHNVVRDTTAWSNLIGMAGADGHAHRNHVGQLTVRPHVAQPTTVDHNVAAEVSVGPGGRRARRWSAIVTRNVVAPPPAGSFNLNGIALQSVSHVLVSHNVILGGPAPQAAFGILVYLLNEPYVASANVLLANTVTGLTFGNGIEIRAAQFGPPGVPDHTALLGNTTNRNGAGIENASATSAFGGNVANDNRGLGITSVAGATDLGGNRASGNNGGFVQCLGVVCH